MNRSRLVLGLLLTAAAGAIDAVSFVRFGAVYASFMSGNTVQLGIHAADGAWSTVGYVLTLVGLFMFGGFFGGVLMGTTGRWAMPLILLINAGLTAFAVWLDIRFGVPLASTAPLSLAMGAQNHLVVLVKGANPGTTFVTGTAFRFGDAVAQRALGRDPHGAWRFHLMVWLSFAVGAALGTLSQVRLHQFAMVPIAGLIGALAIVALVGAAIAARRERDGADPKRAAA